MKLHLGCGARDFGPDWTHIDKAEFSHIKYFSVTDFPFEDNCVDCIYSSHLLEYFDRTEVVPILKEWRRVLKPGGILRTAVPDFGAMAKLYCSGTYKLESFLGPLYGMMTCNSNAIYHKTTYDFDSLKALLEFVGFNNVKRYDWRSVEHAAFDDHSQAYLPHMDKENGCLISLNVECEKYIP